VFYSVVRNMIRPFIFLYHRMDVTGMESIPEEGPLIVAGNHISYLDPFYIACVFPRQLHFMAKEEAFSHPVTRWLLHRFGAFPVNRDKPDIRSIKTAMRCLQEGKVLGIFPEGGRREYQPLTEWKHGAAFLAMKTGAPILPAWIDGTDEALPRGGMWIRPAKVKVRFGRLIHPNTQEKNRDEQERLSLEVLSAFRHLACLQAEPSLDGNKENHSL
jgi:1-acyl-sn-glycerol-3-phosphate acyltransferase